MSGGSGHLPERRCVGCGARMPQTQLLRLGLDRGRTPAVVSPQVGNIRLGRGAYICRRRVCLERAVRRKAFQRAFRENVTVDVVEIGAALDTEISKEPSGKDTAGG